MAYNTRRSGEGVSNVGARRNPPLGNNFVPGGQFPQMNRPPMHQGPRGQRFPNQPNGNFTPQQRMPPPQQRSQGPPPQAVPPPQQVPPPKVQPQQQPQPQQVPPPKVQPQQQQVPPPKVQPQQQPQPQPVIAPEVKEDDSIMEEVNEEMDVEGQGNKRPHFWGPKGGKISRKERQRRRNVRLSKMLQPKNAVMILNELVKSATYTVTDLPQPSEMNQYTATVSVEGVGHSGNGRSKMEAKSMAAEAALKHIMKNRQFSTLKKEEDAEEPMVLEDSPTLPWQHVASFALYKLLSSWGEDPNQNRGLAGQLQNSGGGQPPLNKPAKKLPDNASHMNPLMLLNQMLPNAQFDELERNGVPPNVTFTFQCTIDNESFQGIGTSKKAAKKMAAFAVCHKILAIEYPPEIYTPAN